MAIAAGAVTRNLSGESKMQWRVNLTIRKMGMQCQSCKQDFETVVTACSAEMAVRLAKEYSGANQETHQFSINYVRSLQ
jgi:hypothetical protein